VDEDRLEELKRIEDREKAILRTGAQVLSRIKVLSQESGLSG
jgi:hypothetical protein